MAFLKVAIGSLQTSPTSLFQDMLSAKALEHAPLSFPSAFQHIENTERTQSQQGDEQGNDDEIPDEDAIPCRTVNNRQIDQDASDGSHYGRHSCDQRTNLAVSGKRRDSGRGARAARRLS